MLAGHGGAASIATTFQDVAVVDGSLTLFFKDMGGGNAYVALAGLEIVEAGPPLPSLTVSIVGGFNRGGRARRRRRSAGKGQPG